MSASARLGARGGLYSSANKKNEIMPFAATRKGLEGVIWSEVRQRSRNSVWHPLYVESKKKGYKWTYKTERDSQTWRTDLWLPVHTAILKRERTYCEAQGTLLNFVGQPGWRGVWERMDTGIWMTESLHYSPETITTLLIGYTPTQNKNLKKKKS